MYTVDLPAGNGPSKDLGIHAGIAIGGYQNACEETSVLPPTILETIT